jgi:predicted nucleic acid-binding protein
MKDEWFFDTNIIVYAYDTSEPGKQKICAKLLETVYRNEIMGIVSNQILGEVFKTLTKNIEKPIKVEDAELIIKNIADSDKWIKINYDHETVKKAILIVRLNKASFWDAVIGETMKENGIFKIYTENDKDFGKIPGIKVTNPLRS